MPSLSFCLAIATAVGVVAAVLFIVFGQVTVKKLRSNVQTRQALGIEFVSGWDILNVAEALSLPRWWSKKLNIGPLARLDADAEILREHVNRLDRILAVAFYVPYVISSMSFILLMALDLLGFFG